MPMNNCNDIELSQALDELEVHLGKIDKWVNGDENTQVNLGGVNTDSIRKLVAYLKSIIVSPQLDIATKESLGIVQIGDGLDVTESGIISLALQTGAGLATDEDGALYVDFSQMPTDKFDALLKSLRLPMWLTADKNFYVDTEDGSNTMVDGRGESADLPFKTITACAQYVTENYNVSKYQAIINVTNRQNIPDVSTLPAFSYTTGSCVIRTLSDSGSRASFIQSKDTREYASTTFNITGGNWIIDGVSITLDSSGWKSTQNQDYLRGITVDTGATCTLQNVVITAIQDTATENFERIQSIVAIRGGIIKIGEGVQIQVNVNYDPGENNIMTAITVYEGSQVMLDYNADSDKPLVINGKHQYTLDAQGGYFARNYPGLGIIVSTAENNPARGKRYTATAGGRIETRGGGEEFIPGDALGTLESATYCWYR